MKKKHLKITGTDVTYDGPVDQFPDFVKAVAAKHTTVGNEIARSLKSKRIRHDKAQLELPFATDSISGSCQ